MKRSLPLNAVRVFELAAQHSSFTKASEELALTPAAVSAQVKLLESYLGTPLFVRRNNRLKLTAAGENYFPRVRDVFRALQQATDQVLGQRNASLRVSVPLFVLSARRRQAPQRGCESSRNQEQCSCHSHSSLSV